MIMIYKSHVSAEKCSVNISGPVAIQGLCSTCGKDTTNEKPWFAVSHFMENYASGIKAVFENYDDLSNDHPLNPKYLCNKCSKEIRGHHGLPNKDFKKFKLSIIDHCNLTPP
jgi:DNA-directed RNA polymerase subunit RPC12/RpoP